MLPATLLLARARPAIILACTAACVPAPAPPAASSSSPAQIAARDEPPRAGAGAPATPPDAAIPAAHVVAQIVRSECRSSAPAYELTISASGEVVFVGKRNVTSPRREMSQIDDATRAALVDRIRKRGFKQARKVYRCEPTPARPCSLHPCLVAIRIEIDGTLESVTWSNDALDVPGGLGASLTDIEQTTGATAWIVGP